MVVVITALSTLVGGLYGGFEVYKDYMDMKKKILSYRAPDMSGFDKKLAVMNETMGTVTKEMASVRNRVQEVQGIGIRGRIRDLMLHPSKTPYLRSINAPVPSMRRPVQRCGRPKRPCAAL